MLQQSVDLKRVPWTEQAVRDLESAYSYLRPLALRAQQMGRVMGFSSLMCLKDVHVMLPVRMKEFTNRHWR